MIQFKLRELMAQTSRIEGQRITYADIHHFTGISPSTLSRLAQPNAPRLIGVSVIDRLCAYFECQPGDLMTHIPDKPA